MEEVKKQNAELTKYSEASNTYSGTSGNWSKQEFNSHRPDFDYSRFKKSKWEWFGKFIGFGIFAFILHLLVKSCFAILICLFCLPVCAQQTKRMPDVKSKINQQQVNMINQKVIQQHFELKKKQQLLPKIDVSFTKNITKNIIKATEDELKKRKEMMAEYEVPLLAPREDIRNRKQLYDSAIIYLIRTDTLNYIKYLKRSVSALHPQAIYLYGLSIIEEVGMRQNTDIGLSYVNQASEMNCPEATHYIGELYDFGYLGYKKDSVMALRYYEKSAEQGGFDGAVCAGDRYYDAGDTIKAVKYWKQAYDLKRNSLLIDKEKNILAQIAFNLGYLSSLDSHKEIETRNYFKTSAELGNPEGQAWYGNCCMLGYGMEKDSVEAVYWYKKAALQKHVGAMCALPEFYFDAQENDSTIFWGTQPECRDSADIQYIVGAAYYVKEDYENAEEWWEKAASQNQIDAIWWLYIHYDEDRKDSLTGFKYLRQAADLELPEALNDMGYYYLNGYIVSKDISKAVDYFERSAKLGYTEAYNYLGSIFFMNKYGVRNRQLAVSYWKQGAEAGNPGCQYNYGYVLKKGRGVEKDKQQAIHWFTLSAQNGNEGAQKELKKMGIKFEDINTQKDELTNQRGR